MDTTRSASAETGSRGPVVTVHAVAGPAVLSVVALPPPGWDGPGFAEALAERLRQTMRWTDVLLPQGPDRFALLCNGIPGEPVASAVAERLEAALARPLHIDGSAVQVTATIGIAMRSATALRPVDLLDAATVARWRAAQWVSEALGCAEAPQGAVLVLRGNEPDDAEVLIDLVGGSRTPDAPLAAGAGIMLRLPGARLVDALALGEEIRSAWPALHTAAASITADGQARLVASGVQVCA